jgi:IPT/TIG domain
MKLAKYRHQTIDWRTALLALVFLGSGDVARGQGNSLMITDINPSSASVGGPKFDLLVYGSGFVSGSAVHWNGMARPTFPAGPFPILRAEIPASDIATVGTADITVVNPGGIRSNARRFIIGYPQPRISSINPVSAGAGGPTFTLTVDGANFVNTSIVRWNGSDRVTMFVNATRLTASIPANDIATAGVANVTVFNPPPGGGQSSPQTFRIGAATPTITSLSPNAKNAGGSDFDLIVNGFNFEDDSTVLWNGSRRDTIGDSSRQLRARIRSTDIATAGMARVRVSNPGGVNSNEVVISIPNPQPVLCCFNRDPEAGQAGGPGFKLTVYGSHFVRASKVRWNTRERETVFRSSTTLEADILAADIASAGTAMIDVINPPPNGGISPSRDYLIKAVVAGAPRITRLDPPEVSVGGPDFTLRVIGEGFVSGSTVRYNNQDRMTTVVSNRELTARILASDIKAGGVAVVTVVNPPSGLGLLDVPNSDGGEGNDALQPKNRPAPAIRNLSRSSATVNDPPFVLTVTGRQLQPDSMVEWNDQNRTHMYVSEGELTANVLAGDLGSVGTAGVTVSTPGPGGGETDPVSFSIRPAPTSATLFYPRLANRRADATSPGRSDQTAISFVNLSGTVARLTATAFDQEGDLVTGQEINNPLPVEVEGGEQRPFFDWKLFGPGLLTRPVAGWFKLESNTPKIAGFFLTNDDSFSTLEGADVSSTTLTDFVLPEIEDQAQGFTEIHVANPNTEPVEITFYLYRSDGTQRIEKRTVKPNGALAESVASLFLGDQPSRSDYIRATSTRGVVAFEYFGKIGQDASGLNAQDATGGARTLYSPQYVVGGPVYRSTLSIINLEEVSGQVTLEFIRSDGMSIGMKEIPINPREKIHINAQNYFIESGNTQTEGYVKITSNGPRLTGSVVFGDVSRNTFSSALPLVSNLQKDVVFSHAASEVEAGPGTKYFTGIAIVNPNSAMANVTIGLRNASGSLVVEKTEIIPARQRISKLLTQYFPGLEGQQIRSGYIMINSDQTVASFALFGDSGSKVLAAIPPQVVPGEP